MLGILCGKQRFGIWELEDVFGNKAWQYLNFFCLDRIVP